MLLLLWAHVPALGALAALTNATVAHGGLGIAALVGLAAAASLSRGGRHVRSALVTLGLLTCSALAVRLSGGMVEAQFHLFVMIGVLVLYEDLVPFGLALAYVLLHVGVLGVLEPSAVQSHVAGRADPWHWAAVHGGFIGALSVAAIIGWRANARVREEALERSERFTRVVRDSPHASFSLTDDAIITNWNRAAEALFGYEAAEIVGRPAAILVPEALRGESDAITTVLGYEQALVRETECLRKDGSLVPVEVTVAPIRDATGRVVERSALARDITERRQAQAALDAERERFERAFEQAPTGMALADLSGTILQANAALAALLGEKGLAGRNVRDVVHPEDFAAARDDMRALVAGEVRLVTREQRYRHANGEDVWVELHLALGRQPDGAASFIAHVVDISARKARDLAIGRYADELKARAGEDPLTGLANRGRFDADLRREAEAAPEEGFALVLLTLAGLRRVNDERGHAAGDAVLRGVADALADAPAYRFGGATFALLLPGADEAAARAQADRMRDAVEGAHPGIRVIDGVACWPEAGPTADLVALRAEVDAQERRRRADAVPTQRAAAATRLPKRVGVLLEIAREHLGMDIAWLSELAGDELTFRAVDGDAESFGFSAGFRARVDDQICGHVLSGRLDDAVPDASVHPLTAPMAVTQSAGIGAYVGVPVELASGRRYGMLCTAGHAGRPELGRTESGVLRAIAAVIADHLDEVDARREQVETTGLHALLAALDARDHYTGSHSEAVVELSGKVARRLGLPAREAGEVEQIALLHDVGKIGIPDTVLQKPGPLDELEWELMRQHSALGARIVASIGSLAHLAPAVRAEHERWDGGGYPDGLAGEAIPLAARIILATDAFHAMTSDRPYRRAMPLDAALAELEANAGTQFDPDVVAALVVVVRASAPAVASQARQAAAGARRS